MRIVRASVIVIGLASISSCQAMSCGPHPRRLEFPDYARAEKIDVIGTGREKVAEITDKAKIRDAAAFVERYHDGWIDAWTGPRAPSLQLQFYKDGKYLGEFGIADDYLVDGFLSRDVPPSQIAQLASRLGLQWPPAR